MFETIEEAPPKTQIVEVKTETPSVQIASYHHPHHLTRQHSARQGSGN